MAMIKLDNFDNSGDKGTYFPVFSENKLKIYRFSYEWWVEEYLHSIKDKYSYRDIIVCNQDICSSDFSKPYTLQSGNGKRYDVVESYVSDISSNKNRYGGNRTCEYIAEVNYYPKLYILLKDILKNQGIIDLKDIANYFKEYLGEVNYIKDEREIVKKDITSISFDSIEIGNPEMEAGLSHIRNEVIHFPISTLLQLEREIDVVNDKIVVDIHIGAEELEYLRNCYYIGKVNKAAIDYINDDLKYKNINNRVYKKQVKE